MKLKQLSSILSQVKVFDEPDYELEQYPTSSLLASKMIFQAHSNYDDIQDRDVADFGCGTCMLSLAAVGSTQQLSSPLPFITHTHTHSTGCNGSQIRDWF